MRKQIFNVGRRAGWRPVLMVSLLALAPLVSRAQDQVVLNVRHDHWKGGCEGRLIFGKTGVQYDTAHKKHARTWTYPDVKVFEIINASRVKIYSYEDQKWRFGADKVFDLHWSDREITAQSLYDFLKARTDKPIVAQLLSEDLRGRALYTFPVKHLHRLGGCEGELVFGSDYITFKSDAKEESRTWRYSDIEAVESAGPYDLVVTTYEPERFNYASRRVFNFQLKEPLSRETYNALWRFVNGNKGLLVYREFTRKETEVRQ